MKRRRTNQPPWRSNSAGWVGYGGCCLDLGWNLGWVPGGGCGGIARRGVGLYLVCGFTGFSMGCLMGTNLVGRGLILGLTILVVGMSYFVSSSHGVGVAGGRNCG